MTLATTAAWREAMSQSGVRPVWLVRIRWATGSTEGVDRLSFTSASRPLFGYPASVASVAPMAYETTIEERRGTIGAPTVTLKDDGVLRRLAGATLLRNQLVDIYLGAEQLQESDFARVGMYSLHDLTVGEGSIQIALKDVEQFVLEYRFSGYFVNRHPLEIVQALLDAAGVPASLYDATSLDPSTVANQRVAHFNVTRQRKGLQGMTEPSPIENVPASELIQELMLLLGGSFVPDEAGFYRFALYDQGAGVAHALDRLIDVSEWEQVSTFGNLANRIEVDFGVKTGGWAQHWVEEDSAARVAAAPPGGDLKPVTLKFESPWLNGFGRCALSWTAGTAMPQLLTVWGAGMTGFCGCRIESLATGPYQQPLWAIADVDHPVYLLIEGRDEDGVLMREVVRCEFVSTFGATLPTPPPGYTLAQEPYLYDEGVQWPVTSNAYADQHTWPNGVVFEIVARAQLGTTAQNWSSHPQGAPIDPNAPLRVEHTIWRSVVDVTIAHAIADAKLARLAYGCPKIRVRCRLRRIDIQVGELVTLPHPKGVAFGRMDGFTIADAFEVIRKEVHQDHVEFLLAYSPPFVAGTAEYLPDEGFAIPVHEWGYQPEFSVGEDGGLVITLDGRSIFLEP